METKTNKYRMKQVIFLTTLLIILSNITFAQNDTLKFRDPVNYSNAIEYYKSSQSKINSALHNTYQLACYYSLSSQNDSAFVYLNKAIEKGSRAEDVITDTDFNPLHTDNRWQTVIENLKSRYLVNYKSIANPTLSVELWLLGIDDQRYRTLIRNYKLKERFMETPDMWEKRIDYIKKVIKSNGWPTITMVGEKAAESTFLIMQHANLDDIKKVLPLLIDAANKGEARCSHAAMMIDRYLSMTEVVQIYGTQFHSKGNKNKATGKVEFGVMTYFPIADEENLDIRRKSTGMKSFEEYCKGFKVEYKKPSERGDYKNIPIKNSWIKKGYIIGISN